MKKLCLFLGIFTFLAATLYASGKAEATWPDPEKTITVVVPYSAGGGTDLIFRSVVEEMKKASPANIIISNVGGAGSATGTNEVLNQPADGYTILASGTHTVAATLQGLTEGYKEMEGIASLNWDPFIIAVLKERTWNTMKDMIAEAKKNPGKISLGNAGMGGATGVASVGLNLAFDKAFNVTPFSGGKDLLASVLGGHVDAGIFSQSEMLSNKDKLKALVILYSEHSVLPDLKDIPTMKEAGLGDLNIPGGSFRSFSVKKGTPPDVKKRLAAMIKKAYDSKTFQDFMNQNGLLPAYYELDKLDAYFDELVKAYLPILKEAGLLK
ncbi:MAG TPA: tripartite tricarboxylate transporter substrate binding protein [Spirochaetia bacterium]|nr:tripartite tricarboxylate transporter substrate binding protein [Spirochaetia bacterium]